MKPGCFQKNNSCNDFTLTITKEQKEKKTHPWKLTGRNQKNSSSSPHNHILIPGRREPEDEARLLFISKKSCDHTSNLYLCMCLLCVFNGLSIVIQVRA